MDILSFINKKVSPRKLEELEEYGRTDITSLDIESRIKLVAEYRRKHPGCSLDYVREGGVLWLVVKRCG